MSAADHSVAIIIAAYNAEATIGRAIQSALAEPEVKEIFVVDDASRDGTIAQARAADDGSGRLHILCCVANGGPSVARNMALAQAKSTWVGVLDADDFFLPGRIAALLKEGANDDLIADDMWQVSEKDVNGLRTPLLEVPLDASLHIDFIGFIDSAIPRKGRTRGELSFIKPLMRRALMEQHGIRYQEQMRLGEDFEIYARLLGVGGKLVIIPNRGYMSVVRPNSLSAVHSAHDLLQLRDCHDALRKDLPLSKTAKKVLAQHRSAIDKRAQWRLLIDAVKQKNLSAALKCFSGSPCTSWYLLTQLLGQVYLRGRYGNDGARALANSASTARHDGA